MEEVTDHKIRQMKWGEMLASVGVKFKEQWGSQVMADHILRTAAAIYPIPRVLTELLHCPPQSQSLLSPLLEAGWASVMALVGGMW